MDRLEIAQTEYTPQVVLDHTGGKWLIKGKSFWENSYEFYAPVLKWIDDYAVAPAPATEVDLQFDYFNTSTAKILMDIFRRLEKINSAGTSKVVVNWHFNEIDEDLQEVGEEYAQMLKLTFNHKPFK